MNLIVRRQDFYSCLQKVQPFIGKKATMPILSHVLLKAEKNELTMMATDLELAFKSSCPANISTTGELPVAGKALYNFIRSLQCEELKIKANESQWLEFIGGNSRLCLATLPPEQFPSFPSIEHFRLVSISGELLRKGLIKTFFSMAREDIDADLAGLCVEKLKDKLRFVSSDSYRLTYMEIPFENTDSFLFEKNIMLPRKAVLEMLRLCSTDILEIGFDENAGVIKAEGFVFYFRLKENKFPEYIHFFPKKNEYEAEIPRAELKDSLKRIAGLLTEKFKVADFIFQSDKLLIQAENPSLGKLEEVINIKFSGEFLKISFNISFFLDILNVMDSDNIVLGLNTGQVPAVVMGEKDIGFKALIMPLMEEVEGEE